MAVLSISTNVCRACSVEKPMGQFYVKTNRFGLRYADNICKDCHKAAVLERKRKTDSDPILAERKRIWRREYKRKLRNGEVVPWVKGKKSEALKAARRKVIDCAKGQHDAHVKAWRKRMAILSSRLRTRATPEGKLHNRISVAVRSMLTMKRPGESWQKILGFTPKELKVHIERQFLKGMTWDNMDEWHIDHIVPRASFKGASQEHIVKHCWSLTNLRPLWAKDNMRKSDARTHLL